MTFARLIRASLAHHARSHAAVALAVLTGCAVLTGALVVGDSMRGSLRDLALSRLAGVEHALVAPRFFTERLARHVQSAAPGAQPAIVLAAQVMHAESRRRENRATLIGVAAQTATPGATEAAASEALAPDPGALSLCEPLARRIGAKVGDEVIVSVATAQVVPAETLLGRRDELAMQFRLRVGRIAPLDHGLMGFSPTPTTLPPLNALIDLSELQKRLGRQGRVNAILVAAPAASAARLDEAIDKAATPADFDLSVRIDEQHGYAALETARILLEPPVEQAARAAAAAIGCPAEGVLAYLVNDLAPVDRPDGIPYSVAAGLESFDGLTLADGSPAPPPGEGDILLNTWAADDLGAQVGDTLRLRYFVSRPFGKLEESTETMTVRGVVRLDGAAADPGLTPTYEGITTTERLAEWDAPFPMDMKRIRPKDEEYWNQHRATPKAFVSLAAGQRLWAEADERFGRLTSIRLRPAGGQSLGDLAARFERALLDRLDPAAMGLRFEPLREQALARAAGNTDFGLLFIGFSMFLIAAAFMLVWLVFRLGVERRGRQIGLLLAIGLRPRNVSRLLMAEGAVVAAVGTLAGAPAAAGYAWLMLTGLRTWWPLPGGTLALRLHCDGPALWIGPGVSFAAALVAIAAAVRSLSRRPPRALVAGETAESAAGADSAGAVWPGRIAVAAAAGAIALTAISTVIGMTRGAPPPVAFFAAGAMLLIAGLTSIQQWTSGRRGRAVSPGAGAVARLGLLNARRHPGRSLTAAGLIAFATFVVVSVGAQRRDVSTADWTRAGGLGGFALLAESVAPVAEDLGTPQGRAAVGLSIESGRLLRGSSIQSFRVQPGEDASCQNLYRVGRPRVLGATGAMIARGGFSFAGYIDAAPDERLNPWRLLNRTFPDVAGQRVVPVIADANTATWLLHLRLGQDWPALDERGRPVQMRLVATLAGSVLQGELIVSEAAFQRLYPSVPGYSFFLIDVPPERAGEVEAALEQDLSYLGFDATAAAERLAAYLAVENTYLLTFQALGGLGLVLGAVGLAAVMLRNVLERRRELALLRAVGFGRAALRRMVLAENAALLAAGLVIGVVAAAVAVGPRIVQHAGQAPWAELALTLAACALVGLAASALAAGAVSRMPLLASLRRD